MKPAGPIRKPYETVLLVEFLKTVEDTADHIVAAGGLTTRKDDADVERLFYADRIIVMLELYYRQSVGVREQSFDFFLIGY